MSPPNSAPTVAVPLAAVPSVAPQPAYRRILLKLSGEALMGDESYGIKRETIDRIAIFFAVLRREPRAWIARPPITWACSQR
jgi:hypothetical protein